MAIPNVIAPPGMASRIPPSSADGVSAGTAGEASGSPAVGLSGDAPAGGAWPAPALSVTPPAVGAVSGACPGPDPAPSAPVSGVPVPSGAPVCASSPGPSGCDAASGGAGAAPCGDAVSGGNPAAGPGPSGTAAPVSAAGDGGTPVGGVAPGAASGVPATDGAAALACRVASSASFTSIWRRNSLMISSDSASFELSSPISCFWLVRVSCATSSSFRSFPGSPPASDLTPPVPTVLAASSLSSASAAAPDPGEMAWSPPSPVDATWPIGARPVVPATWPRYCSQSAQCRPVSATASGRDTAAITEASGMFSTAPAFKALMLSWKKASGLARRSAIITCWTVKERSERARSAISHRVSPRTVGP